MMRVRKDPAERRRELMAAAQALFEAKGYGRTTVQDICQRAGVAKGTFFYYFATKEAMLGALLTQWAEQLVASYRRQAAGLSPVRQLRLALACMAQENSIEPLLDRLLEERRGDLVADLWQGAVIVRFSPLLREALETGVADGTFSGDHMEERLAFFWRLLDAMWPDACREESDEAADICMGIAVPLIEQLFGAEAGSLQGFLGGDRT